jgi:hypothetical protein
MSGLRRRLVMYFFAAGFVAMGVLLIAVRRWCAGKMLFAKRTLSFPLYGNSVEEFSSLILITGIVWIFFGGLILAVAVTGFPG